MNIRRIVVATGLAVSLLTAGCASAVAGQAQIASGAALPTTSQSAPSPFPEPTGNGSSSSDAPTGDNSTSSDSSTSSTSEPTGLTENTPTGESSSSAEDTPGETTPATSIPGLSKDCTAVFAGITAFGSVLQGGTADDTISQATVDKALAQLPASGLAARPQADITVLRTVVSGAAGKTVSEVSMSIVDGKVVTALKDLTSWAQDNCS